MQIIYLLNPLGNYHLLQDKEMFPIRGQILKVEAPWVTKFHSILDVESEDLIYILPRSDCIIVGGTAQVCIKRRSNSFSEKQLGCCSESRNF